MTILTYVATKENIWAPGLGSLGKTFSTTREGVRAGQVGKYHVASLEDTGNFVKITFQTGDAVLVPWANVVVASGKTVDKVDTKPTQVSNQAASKPVNGPTNS